MAVVINGSTGIATPDGSAGTPSLAGTTSSTAGVLYPAANVIAFSTNSIERARIDSSGVLNVGTSAATNPGQIKLYGSTSGSVTLQTPAAAGSNTLTLPAATGTVSTTGFSVAMSIVFGG